MRAEQAAPEWRKLDQGIHMSQNRNDRTNLRTSNELNTKQWGMVAGAAAATVAGGPVVVATATLGTVAGCYVSNVVGWSSNE